MEDRYQLEEKLESSEEKLHSVQSVLSHTQALLLIERSNSQQLALHIDLLQVRIIILFLIVRLLNLYLKK